MNSGNKIIELSNIEIHEHCMLNTRTGEKIYNKGKKEVPCFTGFYFKDKQTFFALYPTINGPTIFYDNKEYPITRQLTISLLKDGSHRRFVIREYGIQIDYQESIYLNFDVWSTEMAVDLFYKIEQSYKTDKFYDDYTLKV